MASHSFSTAALVRIPGNTFSPGTGDGGNAPLIPVLPAVPVGLDDGSDLAGLGAFSMFMPFSPVGSSDSR